MVGTLLNGREIKDRDLKDIGGDKSQVTIQDIISLSRNPAAGKSGLRMEIVPSLLRLNTLKLGKLKNTYLGLFAPEYGQKIVILNNISQALLDQGRHQEAIEAFRLATEDNPKYLYPYLGLGLAFLKKKKHNPEEIKDHYCQALEAFRQVVAIDPNYHYSYFYIGDIYERQGRSREAIEAYQKYIELADSSTDKEIISRVKESIKHIQESRVF